MSRSHHLLIWILIISIFASARLPAQEPPKQKRRALLVGVSTYQKTGFASRPLPYAAEDMIALAKELKNANWEVTLLISKGTINNATRSQIDKGIDRLLSGVNANDLVLIAMSGHGQQFRAKIKIDNKEESLEEAFFCPSDSEIGVAESMMGMTELTRRLGAKGGKNLVLIDACRDDPRKGGVRGMDGNTVRNLPGNTSILFSCAAGQQSFETNRMFGENENRGHGVFFHRVLQGLRGDAKGVGNSITWADLSKYVSDNVNDDAVKWFPERAIVGSDGEKIVQTPHAIGNLIGRSPVLVNVASSSTRPSNPTINPLPPAEMRGDISVRANVVYGQAGGVDLTLDVITPSKAKGIGVLVVVSGGWHSRKLESVERLVHIQSLLSNGLTCFAVYHRSAPQFTVPDAVADISRSIRFIRWRAAEFGVDPGRLGAFGASTGGQLALLLATSADDGDPKAADVVLRQSSRIGAAVAMFPITDLRGWATNPPESLKSFKSSLAFDPKLEKAVSPLPNVSKDTAPCLLIHGEKDALVPIEHSRKMIDALERAKVQSQLIVVEGGGHGFPTDKMRELLEKSVGWFEKHLATK